jgi:hypothetical protein
MAPRPARTCIYTLADHRYFVGLVALLNSLRLTGNRQELVVLDCGLEERQRALVSAHATVVRLPADAARRHVLAKPYVHRLAAPSELVVWIDSDVIVTGSIDGIVAGAARGSIGVFPVDWPEQRGRCRPEWPELFSLTAPLRSQTYVNAGFCAVSTSHWPTLLQRWSELCARIPDGVTFHGEIDSNPLWAGDQDALNALLMSEIPERAVHLLPEPGAVFPPDMERVEIVDLERLACSIDGAPVTMLHYSWVPKPWVPRAWRRMDRPLQDAYARLLPRVIFGDDVPLALEPHDVPAWLRAGAVGTTARRGVAVARPLRRLGTRVAEGLPDGLQRRLVAIRDGRETTRRG